MSDRTDSPQALDPSFEQWLRRSAPGIRPRDSHRCALRLTLQARRHQGQRRRNQLLVTCGVLAIMSIAAFGLNDVVSWDFRVIPYQDDETGVKGYTSVIGDQAMGGGGHRSEFWQAYLAKRAAGETFLTNVKGFTLDSGTFWTAGFVFDYQGKEESLPRNPSIPVRDMSTADITRMTQHIFTIYGQYYDGEATYLGCEDCFCEGCPVRLHRWRIELRNGKTAVYSEGTPLAMPEM